MDVSSMPNDEALLKRLRAGDATALDDLFRRYYAELCRVANRYVRDESQAEDIIQDFFVYLWEKRATLPPDLTSAAGYFRRAARNRSLNYLRDRGRIPLDDGEIPVNFPAEAQASDGLEQADLQRRITHAIDRLPERCRLVFTMSKLDEMSNKEIAESLEISHKTVENQMTRAYRFLRQWLAILLVLLSTSNAHKLLAGGLIPTQTSDLSHNIVPAPEKITSVLGVAPNFGVHITRGTQSPPRK